MPNIPPPHPQHQQNAPKQPGQSTKERVSVVGIPAMTPAGVVLVNDAGSSSVRLYTPMKVVGDGSFGTVWLCDWHSPLPSNTPLSPMQRGAGARPEWTGKRLVAVKRMKKRWEGGWDDCRRLKELDSLRLIPPHDNIIPLYDYFLLPSTKELYFVFECMEGNLYQLIKARKGKPFAGGLIASIFRQVANGLHHIHASGYFHRDMKPENLLATTTGLSDYAPTSPLAPAGAPPERDVVVIVKLADFGLARETASKPPYTDYVSTRWYRAPEVLLRSRDYSNPVDLWAFGTILAELVTLKPLFPGQNEIDQVAKICEVLGEPSDEYGVDERGKSKGGGKWPRGVNMARASGFAFPKHTPKHFNSLFDRSVPPSLIECISDLLKYEPSARLTTQDCVSHRYLSEMASLVITTPRQHSSHRRHHHSSNHHHSPTNHHHPSNSHSHGHQSSNSLTNLNAPGNANGTSLSLPHPSNTHLVSSSQVSLPTLSLPQQQSANASAAGQTQITINPNYHYPHNSHSTELSPSPSPSITPHTSLFSPSSPSPLSPTLTSASPGTTAITDQFRNLGIPHSLSPVPSSVDTATLAGGDKVVWEQEQQMLYLQRQQLLQQQNQDAVMYAPDGTVLGGQDERPRIQNDDHMDLVAPKPRHPHQYPQYPYPGAHHLDQQHQQQPQHPQNGQPVQNAPQNSKLLGIFGSAKKTKSWGLGRFTGGGVQDQQQVDQQQPLPSQKMIPNGRGNLPPVEELNLPSSDSTPSLNNSNSTDSAPAPEIPIIVTAPPVPLDPKKAKKEQREQELMAELARRERMKQLNKERARAVNRKRQEEINAVAGQSGKANKGEDIDWQHSIIGIHAAKEGTLAPILTEKGKGKRPLRADGSTRGTIAPMDGGSHASSIAGRSVLDVNPGGSSHPHQIQHMQMDNPDSYKNLLAAASIAEEGDEGSYNPPFGLFRHSEEDDRYHKARRRDQDDDHSMSSADMHSMGRRSMASLSSMLTTDSDPGPRRGNGAYAKINRTTSVNSLRSGGTANSGGGNGAWSPSARSSNSLDHGFIADFASLGAGEQHSVGMAMSGSPSPPPVQMGSRSPVLAYIQQQQQFQQQHQSRRQHPPSSFILPPISSLSPPQHHSPSSNSSPTLHKSISNYDMQQAYGQSIGQSPPLPPINAMFIQSSSLPMSSDPLQNARHPSSPLNPEGGPLPPFSHIASVADHGENPDSDLS